LIDQRLQELPTFMAVTAQVPSDVYAAEARESEMLRESSLSRCSGLGRLVGRGEVVSTVVNDCANTLTSSFVEHRNCKLQMQEQVANRPRTHLESPRKQQRGGSASPSPAEARSIWKERDHHRSRDVDAALAAENVQLAQSVEKAESLEQALKESMMSQMQFDVESALSRAMNHAEKVIEEIVISHVEASNEATMARVTALVNSRLMEIQNSQADLRFATEKSYTSQYLVHAQDAPARKWSCLETEARVAHLVDERLAKMNSFEDRSALACEMRSTHSDLRRVEAALQHHLVKIEDLPSEVDALALALHGNRDDLQRLCNKVMKEFADHDTEFGSIRGRLHMLTTAFERYDMLSVDVTRLKQVVEAKPWDYASL